VELYIHKASVGKTNVLGITRYSDYNSAAVMLDRTRGGEIIIMNKYNVRQTQTMLFWSENRKEQEYEEITFVKKRFICSVKRTNGEIRHHE